MLATRTITEAIAAWKVVDFSRDLRFQDSVMEGDTLKIVKGALKYIWAFD